jgi:hypothetical protein
MTFCRTGLSFRLVAAVAVALVFSSAHARQGPAQPREARLLSEAPGALIANPIDDATVLRRRLISFDQAGLDAIRAGRNLDLNLFGDVTLAAEVDRAWTDHRQIVHWHGQVTGEPARSVVIILHNGAVWASINAHGGNRLAVYRIRSHRNLGQVVEEIDSSRFAPCATTAEHHVNAPPMLDRAARITTRAARLAPATPGEGGIAGIVNCDGPVIDVMVVYTPQARDLEGGTAAIQALSFGQEDICTIAYQNSQADQRVRIVHVEEVTYTETGNFSTELNRLRNTSDGHMDIVHPLRNTHGADLVALFVSGGNACGIASLMTNISTSFAPMGFSVTATGCAQGNLTFQHELGHNMGCHHDHDNSGPAGAFTYSHGHRFFGTNGTQYRTIMAYAPGARVPHFSHPGINYQGTPTGIAIGLPNEAHNAATLNATCETVADFRPTQHPIEPDCNSNGIADPCDILAGTSPDLNGNGIPDECEPPPSCPGDVNGDDDVDVNDLIAVILDWGPCPAPPAACASDADDDGDVDVDDLIMVILNWGECP